MIYCFCHQFCKQARWAPGAASTRKSVVTLKDRWHLLQQTITSTIFFFSFFFKRNTAISSNWHVYFHSVSHLFADFFFLQKSVAIWEWEQPKVSVRADFCLKGLKCHFQTTSLHYQHFQPLIQFLSSSAAVCLKCYPQNTSLPVHPSLLNKMTHTQDVYRAALFRLHTSKNI